MDEEKFFYAHYNHPKIAKYPLHLATYNGRLEKIESLLSSTDHCLYQLACDVPDEPTCSCLFIALARRKTTIARVYLRTIQTDLVAIQQHFEEIEHGHRRNESRFWLRQRILIAFGADHIDFVRRTAALAELIADPAEMGDRNGLLILLKPNNRTVSGVMWLTARKPGADRKIAEIVDRIYERGGELTVTRKEFRGHTLFDMAARMNMFSVWQSMHSMFGEIVGVRELAQSCRILAEHVGCKDSELIVKKFNQLYMEFGKLTVEDALSSREGTFILQDAINGYVDDQTILDYLISVVAQTNNVRDVLNQYVSDRCGYRSLMSCSFQLEDYKLPWGMLKFKPDLISDCTEWWDTPVKRYITAGPFDRRVHDLILEQLPAIGRNEEFRWELLFSLACKNWSETICEIYALDLTYKSVMFEDRERGIKKMKTLARTSAFDALEFLIVEHELSEEERFRIAIFLFQERSNNPIPESLWTVLDIETIIKSNAGKELLFLSLKNRHMDIYQRLLQHIGDISLNGKISCL